MEVKKHGAADELDVGSGVAVGHPDASPSVFLPLAPRIKMAPARVCLVRLGLSGAEAT